MMMRYLVSLSLGLSLPSCDKPGTNEGEGKSRVAIENERPSGHRAASTKRSAREASSMAAAAEDPIGELRQSLERASSMSESGARDKALAEVVWNAMEIDPEIAHAAFSKLAVDSPEKLRLLRHYAMRLAAEDPEQAIEWASSFGSEHEISAAISHVALEVATQDPLRAANLLVEFGIEGRDLDVAIVQVVQRWAANAPPNAVAWVGNFGRGDVRQASLQAVFERWLVQDPGAAIRWAQAVEDASLRQETERAIAAVLIQQPDATRQRWLEDDTSGYLNTIPIELTNDQK